MKTFSARYLLTSSLLGVGTLAGSLQVRAAAGHWQITRLPIVNAYHPSINNSGEIVWFLNSDGGIFSSTRGRLAGKGINPHLSNSGEVVYADWFGGPAWDLVSTTRGRLTQGGIIDVNQSDFDVNASGEVVYIARDADGYLQVVSTVRGQVTSDLNDHYWPCINDIGEIAWNEYLPGYGGVVMSSIRGMLPGNFPLLLDINNAGDFCFSGFIEWPPGNYSMPHIGCSAHGTLINDPVQFQWDGSINDAGTIVWTAPEAPTSSTWYLYQGDWVQGDSTPPTIRHISATPMVLWPPNHRMVPVSLDVDVVDDTDPSPVARIVSVTCNERPRSPVGDWVITGPTTLDLRADRSGTGKARVYTITVEFEDGSGNTSTGTVTVTVPHDRSDLSKPKPGRISVSSSAGVGQGEKPLNRT